MVVTISPNIKTDAALTELAQYLIPVLVLGWLYMLVDCIRNEPARVAWLLVIVPFSWVGAIIYAFARWRPRQHAVSGSTLTSEKQEQIAQAKRATENIGNPHQFYQLATLYREVGQWENAEAAYEKAIQKDPQHKQSLWGAALVAFQQRQTQSASERLQKLLALDANYKFGEAALLYGRVLLDAENWKAAVEHLKPVVQRTNSLEGRLMLATALKELDAASEAREQVYLTIGSLRDPTTLEGWRSKRLFDTIAQLLKQLAVD